jgi:hypothetical protein
MTTISSTTQLAAARQLHPGDVGGPPRAVVLKWWAPDDVAPLAQALTGIQTRIAPADVEVYLGERDEFSVTIRGRRVGLDETAGTAADVGTVVFSSSFLADPAQHPSRAPAWVQTAIAHAQTIAATIHPLGGGAS